MMRITRELLHKKHIELTNLMLKRRLLYVTKISDVQFTVFAEIEKINSALKIFTVTSGENIDTFYSMLYNDRRCLDNFNAVNLAAAFNQLYAQRWNAAYELYNATESTMGELGVYDVKTTTNSGDYTDVEASSTKRPAYNEDTAQLDESYDKTLTHTNNLTETVTTVNRDISNFETSYNFLNTNLFKDVVFKDVNEVILYPISN